MAGCMLTGRPLSVLILYGLGDIFRYHPRDMLDIPQQNPLKYGAQWDRKVWYIAN